MFFFISKSRQITKVCNRKLHTEYIRQFSSIQHFNSKVLGRTKEELPKVLISAAKQQALLRSVFEG